MEFAKQLRERVRSGEITCSVRIWQRPHVKPGHRYRMGDGEIEVRAIQQIEIEDITLELARSSGFASVADLLEIAKHGRGTNAYLVHFRYVPPPGQPAVRSKPAPKRGVSSVRSDRERKRIARILARLPEAIAVPQGAHLSLEVRKKRFGYFVEDHHGDGRLAIHCKASADAHDLLRELARDQLHVPAYLGQRGWIGLWLDTTKVDGAVVELALRDAYLMTAPKTLVRGVQPTQR